MKTNQRDLDALRTFADDFRKSDGALSQAHVIGKIETLLSLYLKPETYQVDTKSALIRIKSERAPYLKELPESFGVKGGAARLELYRALSVVPPRAKPRDIDLVKRGGKLSRQDHLLERKFMPDDSAHGKGIELIRDIETHLATRDITINEVLWISGNVWLTAQCLFDTLAQILRPSRFRSGTLHTPREFAGLVAVKMLRLKAEFFLRGQIWQLQHLPEAAEIKPFHVAVHLERALAQGEALACQFLEECANWGLFPDFTARGEASLADAVVKIAQELPEGLEFFKSLSLRLRKECIEILKEIDLKEGEKS